MTTKKLLFIISIMLSWLPTTSQQQAMHFFSTDEMPNAVNYLPAPPDTTDAQFVFDMNRYFWGKSILDTERGKQAIEDAIYTTAHLLEIYSEFMGITLSAENTPAIYTMMNNALSTGAKGTSLCKSYYKRVRPFQRFGEPVASGESLGKTSYPSGHTNRGWLAALLMVELNPAAQDAILKRGYEYGQSRVIVGAHWQSDVDAGRVVASACFARLHTSPEFLSQMEAAKEEYSRLTSQPEN